LEGGVGEECEVVGLLGWVAAEEGRDAEGGHVRRTVADRLKAEHVEVLSAPGTDTRMGLAHCKNCSERPRRWWCAMPGR
jgi:hypothetical protein